MEFKRHFIKKGFSLIEVVATVALLGLVAVPFLNIFLAGNKNAVDSREDLIALNLAREKIEMITLNNFENLEEDYYNYRDIYKDTIHDELRDCDEDPEKFYENFSDIWTEDRKERYPRIYNKYVALFSEKNSLKDYLLYSKEHSDYRRYTIVEPYTTDDENPSVNMKKITVRVINKNNDKEIKLVTLVTDYK